MKRRFFFLNDQIYTPVVAAFKLINPCHQTLDHGDDFLLWITTVFETVMYA